MFFIASFLTVAGCDHVIPDGRDLSGGVTCNNNQRLVVPLPAMGPACFAAGVYNIFAPLTAYRVPECGGELYEYRIFSKYGPGVNYFQMASDQALN